MRCTANDHRSDSLLQSLASLCTAKMSATICQTEYRGKFPSPAYLQRFLAPYGHFVAQHSPRSAGSHVGALSAALARIGYKCIITGHGFRQMAHPLLGELGWNPDALGASCRVRSQACPACTTRRTTYLSALALGAESHWRLGA